MEMYSAKITKDDSNTCIQLNLSEKSILISMTEDVPNHIKGVFNQLIVELKKVHFNFKMDDIGSDLFSQIASEYIKQLNGELTDIYNELNHFDLLLKSQPATINMDLVEATNN